LVEWPEDGKHRVVQFIVNGIPYLRFGKNFATYESIVEGFAREIKVQPRIINYGGTRLPFLPEDKGYKMPGMGRCKLATPENGKRSAEFFGFSALYMMAGINGIDDNHLDSIRGYFRQIKITHTDRLI